MAYRLHPYFDESNRDEWIEIPFVRDGTPGQPERERATAGIVLRDFAEITKLVLERFQDCIPDAWMIERPHPLLNDLSFHPIDGGGIRIYLEYVYVSSLTEGSYDTDSWWAIVLCPYATGNPYTGVVDYSIEHMGWSVD